MKKHILFVIAAIPLFAFAQSQSDRDAKVEKFLKEHRDEWHDLNVPFVDGQTLHDLIIKNGYESALEIGTSTGHSTHLDCLGHEQDGRKSHDPRTQ